MAHDQQKSQKGQQLPTLAEDQAREHIEKLRWPKGPACVHCGSTNVYRVGGSNHRPGLLACRDCRGHFTVTVGTVMEDSHLPLSKWVGAFHLICASKKGISALQMQRQLGLGSYKTAWHLCHRIREAMKCEPAASMLSGIVQVDETYVGGKPRKYDGKEHKRGRGTSEIPVVALVETDGRAYSKPTKSVSSCNLKAMMEEAIQPTATIVTDDLNVYPATTAGFAGGHHTVNHSAGQYVHEGFTTNGAESFFALLKHGVYGTFHHVSAQHLSRYCAEFDFRWNGRKLMDSERRDLRIVGAEGKRLMYKRPTGST